MPQPLTAAVRYLSGEREPVRVATTENIVLQGLMTIDDVEVDVGDRVLVKDQTDKRQNGIYLASEGVWFRAPDASYARAIDSGVTVRVQEGTASNGKDYRFTKKSPQLGTDEILLEAIFVAFEEALQAAILVATQAAETTQQIAQDFEEMFDSILMKSGGVMSGTLVLPNDTSFGFLAIGDAGAGISRQASDGRVRFFNPQGASDNGQGGFQWDRGDIGLATLNSVGVFEAAGLSARRPTYGSWEKATTAWVMANPRTGNAGRPAVMGLNQESDISGYFNRDSVGLYAENYAKPASAIVANCTFTATRVNLGTALTPTQVLALRRGMIIDTGHAQKYSGFITSWDTAGGWIDVSGWYLVIGDGGSPAGNPATGQVPSGPQSVYINPQTKTWAINANVFTNSSSQTGVAVVAELGVFNDKADFSLPIDATHTYGVDVVSLGSKLSGWGFTARSGNSQFWIGMETFNAKYAGYVAGVDRNSLSFAPPLYGFLARQATGMAFGIMSPADVPLGAWDGSNGRLQIGTASAAWDRYGNVAAATRNGVQISGAAAGLPASLVTFGVDANISLEVLSKGTGYLMLGRSTNTIGFFGSGGTVKPTITGSRGGNAALAILIASLANMGLVADGTTA